MRAIQFVSAGTARVTNIAAPAILPGHVLVRVKAAGLCHTDIEVLHGRYGGGNFPLVPGHEYAGVIEAVADDVTGIKIGARVAIDPNLPCGTCRSCGKGLTNLCSELKAYGVTTNGGFADYSIVRAEQVHDIGTLPFDTAALAEPLACVLNGLEAAHVKSGRDDVQNALVFGAGPIGLLLALSLKARGVEDVTVVDVVESRLDFASKLGLLTAVSGSASLAAQARQFDFAADATGIPSVVQSLVSFVSDGGTALIFGVCAPAVEVAISPFEIFRRQIKLVGSHSLNRNIPDALAILARDRDGMMARLVSHRLPLEEVLPFLSKAAPAPSTMKVQFIAD